MGTTYYACSKREWFANFEKLDGGLVLIGDGHTCHMKGIGIVQIKLPERMLRELKDVRYVPQLKKKYDFD